MIVVDTNVIAYLLLSGQRAGAAEAWLRADPEWAAPPLWRSDFVNVLAVHVRAGRARDEDARWLLERARTLVRVEPQPEPRDVLELALASGCTAYGCEFVAAAIGLGVRLITDDREVVQRFPDVAEALE